MESDTDSAPPRENEEEPLDLTTYKPENEVFQRLCLCDYLVELLKDPDEEEP